MGFWQATGKLAWGATTLTAKAVTTIAGLTYQGTKVTAKAIYDRREGIGAAAAATAKVAAGRRLHRRPLTKLPPSRRKQSMTAVKKSQAPLLVQRKVLRVQSVMRRGI